MAHHPTYPEHADQPKRRTSNRIFTPIKVKVEIRGGVCENVTTTDANDAPIAHELEIVDYDILEIRREGLRVKTNAESHTKLQAYQPIDDDDDTYSLSVGNIGNVVSDCNNFNEVRRAFFDYALMSELSTGRASGETVTLYSCGYNNEPIAEHIGRNTLND